MTPMLARSQGTKLPICARMTDEADLAQDRRLAGHVGAGDELHPRRHIELYVVRHERLPGHHALDDRVARRSELEIESCRDPGTHIAVGGGRFSERGPHVEPCQHPGRLLNPRDGGADPAAERAEQLCFPIRHPLFGAEDLRLVFLELRGDVALGGGKGLAPLIVAGNLRGVRVGDFDVIPEDLVVSDFERRNSAPVPLPLLDRRDVLLPAVAEAAAFVQQGVEAGTNHASVPELGGGTFGQRRRQLPGKIGKQVELQLERCQETRVTAERAKSIADSGQPEKRIAEGSELPWCGAAGRGPPGEALEVPYAVERFPHGGAMNWIADRGLHGIQTLADLFRRSERREQPAPEQAGAHGGDRPVEHLEQRHPFHAGTKGLDELEVSPGHLVDAEEPVGAADRRAETGGAARQAADRPSTGAALRPLRRRRRRLRRRRARRAW